MGYYVHLNVCFHCDSNDHAAEIARKHIDEVGTECIEAHRFLADLSERTGTNPGAKGGLITWGLVGNCTSGEEFVKVLFPFWEDLLGVHDSESPPFDYERVMVFVEKERTEQAEAYEIFYQHLNGNYPPEGLIIRHHYCSFAWMQG